MIRSALSAGWSIRFSVKISVAIVVLTIAALLSSPASRADDTTPPGAGWIALPSQNRLDDSIEPSVGLSSTFYPGDTPATLMIICRNGSTAIGIAFPGRFFGPSMTTLSADYRVDEQKAERASFVTTGNDLDLLDASKFVKRLLAAHKLFIQADEAAGGGTAKAEFDLAGIDSAVGQVRQACHW